MDFPFHFFFAHACSISQIPTESLFWALRFKNRTGLRHPHVMSTDCSRLLSTKIHVSCMQVATRRRGPCGLKSPFSEPLKSACKVRCGHSTPPDSRESQSMWLLMTWRASFRKSNIRTAASCSSRCRAGGMLPWWQDLHGQNMLSCSCNDCHQRDAHGKEAVDNSLLRSSRAIVAGTWPRQGICEYSNHPAPLRLGNSCWCPKKTANLLTAAV